MKPSSFYLYALVATMFLVHVTLQAAEAKTAPNTAAMMPSVELTPKQDLVKFVPCNDEMDCYRALQESDVESVQTEKSTDGVALVAEFVEGPQKGVRVYRKK